MIEQEKKVKYYTVRLPCRAYIREYYNALLGDPIRVDSRTPVGCFVNAAVEKKRYKTRHIDANFIYRGMEDCLTLETNTWQKKKFGSNLSDENVLLINQMLESLFDLAIFQYCAARVNPETRYAGYTKAILDFCAQYQIDTDHFETLKKLEYRFRKSLERDRKKAVIYPKL